jgi:hypothetical protein
MQKYTPYIWHKFNLHSRKIVFTLFAIWGVCSATAQDYQQTQRKGKEKRKTNLNLVNYDEKLLHYGFFLGVNYNRSTITIADKFFSDSIYSRITPVGEGGFSIGFLANLRLHDQIAFKVVPSVGFYTRTVDYKFNYLDENRGVTTLESRQSVETANVEMQFLLKYRSLRRRNSRMYLIGGTKPAIRVGGRRGNTPQERLNVTRFDFSIDYGAGLEIYFPYFKWSPEIRFSHGIVNINGKNELFNTPIEKLYTHTVSLYIFFE